MTYRHTLREIANEQYGYLTTKDAHDLGVPAVELRKLAQRGALENITRGLYRFTDVRRTSKDLYAEAVLRVGPDAHLDGEAVLALHGLALIEPKRITVATPHRVRIADPGFVDIVQRHAPAEEVTEYDGVPATRVWKALINARAMVMTERLRAALAEAIRRDLVTPLEARRVRQALSTPVRERRLA